MNFVPEHKFKYMMATYKRQFIRSLLLILHDNATLHTAWQPKQCFPRYWREVLQHSTHSSDLAPSDFHLFGHLKWHLSGQWFVNDDIIVLVMTCFQALDQDLFVRGFNALVSY
jgi:hypothetical protein